MKFAMEIGSRLAALSLVLCHCSAKGTGMRWTIGTSTQKHVHMNIEFYVLLQLLTLSQKWSMIIVDAGMGISRYEHVTMSAHNIGGK